MPIYEYEIIEGPEKGKVFEHFHLTNGEMLEFCPITGYKVKRILSVTGPPQFKGSGFYKTDYCTKCKNDKS